jgi:hypothetical protein
MRYEVLPERRVELLKKLLNEMMPKVYPVIKHIDITNQNSNNGDIHYIRVFTTIPDGITSDNYWDSEYAEMDFSWMDAHYVPEILTYLGVDKSRFYRIVYVYNDNDELIGEF